MNDEFVPKIKLKTSISETKVYPFNNPARLENIAESEETPKFHDVMTGLVKSVDDTMKAPDQAMQDVMLGNGADIHDVMIAMSKADIGINIATQVTTKVIQAYEKVMAIQL